jgi:uncharacterized protein (TIGR02246 family)
MTEIQQLFDRYKTAVLEKNVDAFLSIFDSEIHVFDMWGTWSHRGIEAWRKMATEWFGSLGSERVIVEFHDPRIVLSNEMAWATADVTFAAVSAQGEKLRSLQNRLTWVVQKKSGEWKVVHEHTSAPIDPETGKAILKRTP